MLRGYRLFVLAIGLILAGASPPNDKAIQSKPTEQVEPSPAPTPDYTPYPDYNPGPCYQDKNHDTADLCAQWRAALAAEETAGLAQWGNWIAGIAALFSFASIILVLRALSQTDESLKIAQRDRATATRRALAQSEETLDALSIARRNADAAAAHALVAETTADHQLRPYLGIEEILPKHPHAKTREIEIKIRNFGATPAKNIKQEIGFAYVPVGVDSWPTFAGEVLLGREIPPNHFQRALLSLEGFFDQLQSVLQGQGAFRIVLRVSYDGLGKARAPMLAKIIFSHKGAHVAVEEATGIFSNTDT